MRRLALEVKMEQSSEADTHAGSVAVWRGHLYIWYMWHMCMRAVPWCGADTSEVVWCGITSEVVWCGIQGITSFADGSD